MKDYNAKVKELVAALANVYRKQQEYHKAVSLAREKSEELSTLTKTITKQPHIHIDDYEIDNWGALMTFIDHPILYSDDVFNLEWKELIEQSSCQSSFWRKYARRKMRRVAKELLRGVRPRIELSDIWLELNQPLVYNQY